jgi:ATP-dependent Clp protease ATP-binding subunit ClpB
MAGEENYDQMKEAVMNIVGHHFKPEFINRIDDSVVFRPLDKDEIRQIAAIQLRLLGKRLEGRDMGISYTDDALDLIAEEGFDPVYGARPLKRAIQNSIENPLAQRILSGDFATGDTILIDAEIIENRSQFTFIK